MIYLYYLVFFAIALIYSSVGLAGGSAYVGFLALFSVEPRFIPSTAQFLNVVVSLIAFFNYKVHLNIKRKSIIPTFLLAIFGVILGSNLKLKESEFFIILGLSLILAALASFIKDFIPTLKFRISESVVPFISFALGFLTGVVGIGGGIFLSPILLLANFPVKEIASITSVYILLNSSAGFIINYFRGNVNFSLVLPFSLSVLIGGFLGSYLGSFKFAPKVVRKILITIIIIIGGKILWRGIT